ncbi:MAG: hypothetical protein SFT94_05875 [Pseudanabaenaceae cyanobacterium bins.68]|nr:hypothetical protein [Pseudanabaenaceae cyanobacterium bins.68]
MTNAELELLERIADALEAIATRLDPDPIVEKLAMIEFYAGNIATALEGELNVFATTTPN